MKVLSFLSVLLILGLGACSGDSPKSNSTEKPQAQKVEKKKVASSVASSGVGSISGTVTYEGAVPNLKKINMSADPKCVANNKGDVKPHILVLGEGQTLANVFVKISSGLEGESFATPEKPVVLDQKGCMYYPRVVGVQLGQPLKVLNSDGTLHNVHVMADANGVKNVSMPAFRKEITLPFSEVEEAFPVKCDVHPWMKAYIEVLEHPHYATTAPAGTFKLENVPAGEYEVSFWHERLGSQKFTVTVEAGKASKQDVVFKKGAQSASLDAVMLLNQ